MPRRTVINISRETEAKFKEIKQSYADEPEVRDEVFLLDMIDIITKACEPQR